MQWFREQLINKVLALLPPLMQEKVENDHEQFNKSHLWHSQNKISYI